MKWSDFHASVSKPPFSWSLIPAHSFLVASGSGMDLPSSRSFLFPHATCIRPRRSHRTLAISIFRSITRPCCWLPSLLKRRPPVDLLTRLTSLQGGASPLRPMGFSVYASVVSFIRFLLSFTPARLDTSDWLGLGPIRLSPSGHARRGLSPRKKCQASLGAQSAEAIVAGRKQTGGQKLAV